MGHFQALPYMHRSFAQPFQHGFHIGTPSCAKGYISIYFLVQDSVSRGFLCPNPTPSTRLAMIPEALRKLTHLTHFFWSCNLTFWSCKENESWWFAEGLGNSNRTPCGLVAATVPYPSQALKAGSNLRSGSLGGNCERRQEVEDATYQ